MIATPTSAIRASTRSRWTRCSATTGCALSSPTHPRPARRLASTPPQPRMAGLSVPPARCPTAPPATPSPASPPTRTAGRCRSSRASIQGFGAAILEPVTGIVAHDRGACFSLDPASPNLIAGGKRPLHTLMPVMVRRDGRLLDRRRHDGRRGAAADPRPDPQPTSGHERGSAEVPATRDPTHVADAVADPRWIYDEGALSAEADVPGPCLDALRAAGMPLELLEALDETVGHAQYIRIMPDGAMDAGSDPRADGAAVVESLLARPAAAEANTCPGRGGLGYNRDDDAEHHRGRGAGAGPRPQRRRLHGRGRLPRVRHRHLPRPRERPLDEVRRDGDGDPRGLRARPRLRLGWYEHRFGTVAPPNPTPATARSPSSSSSSRASSSSRRTSTASISERARAT